MSKVSNFLQFRCFSNWRPFVKMALPSQLGHATPPCEAEVCQSTMRQFQELPTTQTKYSDQILPLLLESHPNTQTWIFSAGELLRWQQLVPGSWVNSGIRVKRHPVWRGSCFLVCMLCRVFIIGAAAIACHYNVSGASYWPLLSALQENRWLVACLAIEHPCRKAEHLLRSAWTGCEEHHFVLTGWVDCSDTNANIRGRRGRSSVDGPIVSDKVSWTLVFAEGFKCAFYWYSGSKGCVFFRLLLAYILMFLTSKALSRHLCKSIGLLLVLRKR